MTDDGTTVMTMGDYLFNLTWILGSSEDEPPGHGSAIIHRTTIYSKVYGHAPMARFRHAVCSLPN